MKLGKNTKSSALLVVAIIAGYIAGSIDADIASNICLMSLKG